MPKEETRRGDAENTTNPQNPTNRKLAARTGALERPGGLLGARVPLDSA